MIVEIPMEIPIISEINAKITGNADPMAASALFPI
jgi:hypothetical protein